MTRRLHIYLILGLLLLLVMVTSAHAAVDQITIWSLSPNPASVNSDVEINIAFSLTDSDSTHRFCIEAPSDAGGSAASWHGTMPATIPLRASQGFSGETVNFARQTLVDSQAVCTFGTYVALYTGTSGLTNDGSTSVSYVTLTPSVIDLDNGNTASAHTGNWALYLDNVVGNPNAVTYELELLAVPTTVYVSDSPTCLGLGTADHSCFQALDEGEAAADAAGSDTLVVVGDLTVDATSETAVIDADLTAIRGTSSGRILASNCTAETLINVTKNDVTISDLIIDGSACSGAATGIATNGTNVNLDGVTVQDFSSGTGVSYSGTGTGAITDSTFSGSETAISDSSAAIVSIGTSDADGNVLSNNAVGIASNGDASIKGNTISGGTIGVDLAAAASAIFGNSVTGASGNQIDCNGGGFAGAGFNYLGGISPTSGSNCTDVNNQLGAEISSWVEGTNNGDVSVSGSSGVVAIFQLADDPYTYGQGMSDLAGFYAVMDTGENGTVAHAGSGGNQAKMFMAATGCSPMTGSCWQSLNDALVIPINSENCLVEVDVCDESETSGDVIGDRAVTSRPQTGSGYYALGNADPAAVTLAQTQAQTGHSVLFLIWFAMGLALLTGLFIEKRQQHEA